MTGVAMLAPAVVPAGSVRVVVRVAVRAARR
jgi:hypothetical protein